jgi:hypothetical protein
MNATGTTTITDRRIDRRRPRLRTDDRGGSRPRSGLRYPAGLARPDRAPSPDDGSHTPPHGDALQPRRRTVV